MEKQQFTHFKGISNMAGKKDKCVDCVMSDLTSRQASQLVSEFSKAKGKIAPNGRATAAVTDRGGIGSLLQIGIKKITGE